MRQHDLAPEASLEATKQSDQSMDTVSDDASKPTLPEKVVIALPSDIELPGEFAAENQCPTSFAAPSQVESDDDYFDATSDKSAKHQEKHANAMFAGSCTRLAP